LDQGQLIALPESPEIHPTRLHLDRIPGANTPKRGAEWPQIAPNPDQAPPTVGEDHVYREPHEAGVHRVAR
jgi:hypothetical protein